MLSELNPGSWKRVPTGGVFQRWEQEAALEIGLLPQERGWRWRATWCVADVGLEPESMSAEF